MDSFDLAEDRLDPIGSLKVGRIVVEILWRRGVGGFGAWTTSCVADSAKRESLGLEGAGDLLRDRNGGTVVVVSRDGLTDEGLVGCVQLWRFVEEGGDFLLEPHGDVATNELGTVGGEELGADLDGEGIALDLDEDAVVQFVELGVQFEVLWCPMGVDLSVGGDEQGMAVCDEVAALSPGAGFGEEVKPDRQMVRRAVVVEREGVLPFCPEVAGVVLEPARPARLGLRHGLAG